MDGMILSGEFLLSDKASVEAGVEIVDESAMNIRPVAITPDFRPLLNRADKTAKSENSYE